MKKNVLSVLVTVLSASAIIAQEAKENKVDQGSGFNHWSVDLNAGLSKPTAPFTPGYSTETFSNFSHFDLGVRYMFNNKFGLKVDYGHDVFNSSDSSVKEFETTYWRTNIQAVVNLGRALNFEEWTSRLGILLHAGPGYSQMKSDAFNGTDQMVNVATGVTGQIRLSNRVAFNADLTLINNVKQSRTFDGAISPVVSEDRGFNGSLFNATVGLSIYLGKNQKHADWYVVAVEENRQAEDKAAAMQNKLNDLEAKIVDTDKDGIADAFDEEKESAAGAMVDSKGRSIDLNNNGIADSTDKALAAQKTELTTAIKANPASTSTTTSTTTQTPGQAASTVDATKLINDGYVAAYFNLGDARPNNNSAEGIGFVLTYLRNNPTTSVDIIGNTDETGTVEFNNKLAAQRAQNVKNILIKAGVSASRLNIVAKGEDKTVDVNSADARRLVRKVIFKIK
ncbi:MAG: OmpA family protein [Bacteroidota bacterium]